MPYNHKEIEPKWQKKWEESDSGSVTEKGKDSVYHLVMFPYPSGAGLHVGHVESYAGVDIMTRKARMEGKNVLFPMGFDAFGLPAENYAIKLGVHPAETTTKAIKNFTRQLKSVGLDFDWDRVLSTADPSYYKWTQWIFSQFLQNGLAYKKKAPVNWCESCVTVLANEQVIDGRCDRCKSEVVQKELEQWFFEITKYAEQLLAGLDDLDWPDSLKAMQRNWIGKSEGANVKFKISHPELVEVSSIEVFTTRPDTLFGATYMVLAPEHSLVDQLTTEENKKAVEKYKKEAAKKSALERSEIQKEKTGVPTGSFAINPANGEEVPVWIADYVLSTYGTGAIMAVPAHDERDYTFAKKYDLPIQAVVSPDMVDKLNPPKDGVEMTHRNTVHVILRNQEGKIGLLNWKSESWGDRTPVTFITGGVDDGEDLVEAARREVLEETGYTDLQLVETLVHETCASFYAAHKSVNRCAHVRCVVFDVSENGQQEINEDEKAHHDLVWCDPSEVAGKINIPDDTFFWEDFSAGGQAYMENGVLTNSAFLNGLSVADAKDKMIEWLEKEKLGERKTTYRLRDWLVSRQRYWGAPIPVVYDPEGNQHPVKNEHLPLLLPTDVDFKPTGESPIALSDDFKKLAEELYGDGWHFEVDTMDTFVDSSWYFLRYCDPKNEDALADKKALKHWMPVDLYVGGVEHAVLHLLYARFFCYALNDLGVIDFKEPFMKLRNQGMILGPDGQKMSKSVGNVINPDDVVSEFGADTLRLYEMFMGPFEDTKPWDTNGVLGLRRFLDKVHRVSEGELSNTSSEALMRELHKTIKKVTKDIDDMRFNTAISQMMIMVNAIQEDGSVGKDVFVPFVQLLAPFAPHLAEEVWEKLGNVDSIFVSSWPSFDEALARDEMIKMPVQVNGKVRATLSVSPDISEEDAIKFALADEKVKSYVEGEPKKVIFVKGRLINFVV